MKHPHNFKAARNRSIVRLINKDWTLQEVAKIVGLKSSSTVHKIYWRETMRSSDKVPRNAPAAIRRDFKPLVKKRERTL